MSKIKEIQKVKEIRKFPGMLELLPDSKKDPVLVINFNQGESGARLTIGMGNTVVSYLCNAQQCSDLIEGFKILGKV